MSSTSRSSVSSAELTSKDTWTELRLPKPLMTFTTGLASGSGTDRCSLERGSCGLRCVAGTPCTCALAEALEAVLVTTDARLAAAHGPTCDIEVIGGP